MLFSTSSYSDNMEKRPLSFVTSPDGKETIAAAIINFNGKTFYPEDKKSDSSIDVESGYTEDAVPILRVEMSSFAENEKCTIFLNLLRPKIDRNFIFKGKEASMNPNFKEIKMLVEYKDKRYEPAGKKDAFIKLTVTDFNNGVVYSDFDGKLYNDEQDFINISGKIIFKYEKKKEDFIKPKIDFVKFIKKIYSEV